MEIIIPLLKVCFWPFLFIFVIFPALTLGCLYIIFRPMYKNREITNGILNFDGSMRKFVFRIDLSKDEFFSKLKSRNACDTMEYSLNADLTGITFKELGSRLEYGIEIIPCDGYLILRVKQISLLYGKTNIPYHVNEFWICKFNAKPIDYSRNAF